MKTIAVNEIFGVTFQGEGKHIGRPSVFLRLAGCNLACSWCDTPYAWDWKRFDVREESTMLGINRIADELNSFNCRNLVVTGGEPMLQQNALAELTNVLHRQGWATEMETSGSLAPISTELVHHFTVSPKLSNSGNTVSQRYNERALERFNHAPSRAFKFVVTAVSDFDEIDEMVNRLGLDPIYIMPEGIDHITITENMRKIVDETIKRQYNITTRLHVTLYGNRRAV